MTTNSVHLRATAGRRILIVEDEYLIAMEMADHFEAMGVHVVGPAQDARSALAIIEGGERLDGAVLDILLRGDKVYAVADALRERSVPFVFVTGLERDLIPATYAAAACLSKPSDPNAIAQALFAWS